jgi:hypothetical protein
LAPLPPQDFCPGSQHFLSAAQYSDQEKEFPRGELLCPAILNLKQIARTRVAQTVSLRSPGEGFPAAAPQTNRLRYVRRRPFPAGQTRPQSPLRMAVLCPSSPVHFSLNAVGKIFAFKGK